MPPAFPVEVVHPGTAALRETPPALLTPVAVTHAPAAATPLHAADAVTCANCGAAGCEAFCPRCGQETHGLHRSLRGILEELLDAFAGWDGKIPLSFWTLTMRPGRLTREFLDGRRARYLRPLRLYLLASVGFFFALSLLPSASSRLSAGLEMPDTTYDLVAARTPASLASGSAATSPATRSARVSRAVDVATKDSAFDAFLRRHVNEPGHTPLAWVKRSFVRGVSHVRSLPKSQRVLVFREAMYAKAPNAVFVLLPIFALLTRLLYRRARMFYAEHVVFALHVHAFAFLAMTLAHLAGVLLAGARWQGVATLPLLWIPVYVVLALRRVYGGSAPRTLVKAGVLAVTYGAMLGAATIATAMIAIATLA